jgi:hypothetical protein
MYFDQEALIRPIEKTLIVVSIPKSLHPWFDVVKKALRKRLLIIQSKVFKLT